MNINIALCFTEDWAEYALVVVASVLKNANQDDNYKFFILFSQLSDENKNKFLKLTNIRNVNFDFLEVDYDEFTPITHDHLGNVAYFRLKIPELVSESKILYLDSDLMIRHDIAELYSSDISDFYCAGVEDKQSNDMRFRVNLPQNQQFTNSGMLLLNLDKLREANFYKKCRELLTDSQWTDQDVINEFCQDKLLPLPLKYNIMFVPQNCAYQTRRDEYEESIKDPVIIHFSNHKPWHKINQPFCNEWQEYKNLVLNLF